MEKITKENIEALLLDYAEGTLNPQDCKELELFINQNPQYKELLSLYDASLHLTDTSTPAFDKKTVVVFRYDESQTTQR